MYFGWLTKHNDGLQMKSEPLIRKSFPVLQMTCAACAVSVESMLKAATGVVGASVNFANKTAAVEYDPALTQPSELRKVVQSIGYDLIVDAEDPIEAQEKAGKESLLKLQRQTIGAAALTLPVVLAGMVFMDLPYAAYISMALTFPVVFVFGRTFFVHAWKQARHGKANMDTLVALSTGIAFFFSVFNTFFPQFWHSRGVHAHVYYEAAAVIITFISLGKWLEERATTSTGSALRKLVGLQPKTVRVIVDGSELEMPIASIQPGARIIIRPGERIPVDGLIVSGSSYVDESMITGEPIAAEKSPGATVFAGTINQKGSLHMDARSVGADTLLAQIIRRVREAQGSKAPVQRLVDQIAGVFVPVVIIIAVVTFSAWMIFGGQDAFTHALLTSVSVLVIACPCALGLATPTAIMVGVGKGAENNLLIKDAESLEMGRRVDTLVLDKTGTLTEGRPEVVNVHWVNDSQEAISAFYSIELQSEHPLAEAVVRYLGEHGAKAIEVRDFMSITGVGVEAKVEGVVYRAGSPGLLDKLNISLPANLKELSNQWAEEAQTVVYFVKENAVFGVLGIADRVKSTAAEAIGRLEAMNIEVHMLTGDQERTANSVARQLRIRHVRAGVLPGEKFEYIRKLQSEGKVVAMVGDGINDSEALAQADVSIAMGRGSDIAMDVARMTLISTDLNALPKALRLSALTVRGIRQNLFWAFIYNLIGIPIAAGVLYPINGFLLDPMIAGAAMALSSVSVVGNSLRLKWVKL